MSSSMEFGCVFCRTGKEDEVARYLTNRYPGVKAVVPIKARYRRSHGIATEETVVLFPGYVFFSCCTELSVSEINRHQDIYRILTDGARDWRLKGSDLGIARRLISVDGRIGISKAYYDGERIKILEGFLKEFEGSIIRVNHRAKTAQIRVQFDTKTFTAWIGFELISVPDDDID